MRRRNLSTFERVALLLSITMCLVPASVGSSRDIHVNNIAGDDHNNGQMDRPLAPGAGPTQTIGRALCLADFGDRVMIANTGTPYRECITVQSKHSGSPIGPFVIQGNGATLDGTGAVPLDRIESRRGNILAIRPPYGSFQQLFRNGVPLPRRDMVDDTELGTLAANEWCRWNGCLLIRAGSDAWMAGDELAYSVHPVGITLYEVENVLIDGLTVQGFRLDGINAHDNARQCVIRNVVCRGNGRSGISVGGASAVRIESSQLGNNGHAQLRTEGWSTTDVRGTRLIANTGPAWRMDGGRLTIDGRPQYANPSPVVYDRSPLHKP